MLTDRPRRSLGADVAAEGGYLSELPGNPSSTADDSLVNQLPPEQHAYNLQELMQQDPEWSVMVTILSLPGLAILFVQHLRLLISRMSEFLSDNCSVGIHLLDWRVVCRDAHIQCNHMYCFTHRALAFAGKSKIPITSLARIVDKPAVVLI